RSPRRQSRKEPRSRPQRSRCDMSRPSSSTSGCGRRRWSEGTGFHRRSMLYIMVNEDRPDGRAIRDATREAHLAYLERHKSIVVLAGGTLAEDGETRTGSVFIVNVTSREAAEKFSAEEPFRKAGLFKTVKITRMRRGSGIRRLRPRPA